jgi:small subunit ribosomal protein S17
MTKEKNTKQETKIECKNSWCPFHGKEPVKLRGRTFEGTVTKKFQGRIVIEFERLQYIRKYERYQKTKTRLHARLPDCLKAIEIGDLVRITECRPLSKIIHFITVARIKTLGENK